MQYGVVWKIAVHWMALFACNSIALVIWVGLFEQPDVSWKQTVGDSFRRFLPFFVITTALLPAFILDTLKLTNRFAGPVSRLRTEINNAAEGRPVRHLKFRNNDYWREIADGFNALIDRAGLSAEQNDATNAAK
ncbi:putative membrane protein [Rhodopirellula sallentina SM41]|uniref:Putative membrane protein n=1 Tax=Rhodopirellula sallentina SM41 TaxID=1263870 RepID=M5TWP0_9BACT|nr:putative membrane protein [Rhodopirellula sallentina SM41]